jgi:hypothetical protein
LINFFIVPGNTRIDIPKMALEYSLQNTTGLREGDFIFYYNRTRNIMRYFPWKISWINVETKTKGYFPWWPDNGIVHMATQYEYDNLIQTLPLAFIK